MFKKLLVAGFKTSPERPRKALILMLGLLSLAVCLPSQGAVVIAQYPFNGTSLASTDTEANSSAANIVKGGGLSGASVVDTSVGNPASSFRFDKSDVGTSQDLNDYISFTVTANASPSPGFRLDLNGGTVTFDVASSGNGKTVNWAVRSSVDSFGANLASGSTSSTTFGGATANLTGTSFDGLSSIEIRIYGWRTDNNDLFVDNIRLNGDVNAVPEPINVALALFGLAFCGVRFGRRLFRTVRG